MHQFRCPLAKDPHISKVRTGDAQDWSFQRPRTGATERCLGGGNVEDEHFRSFQRQVAVANIGKATSGGSQSLSNVADNRNLDGFNLDELWQPTSLAKFASDCDVAAAISKVRIKAGKIEIRGRIRCSPLSDGCRGQCAQILALLAESTTDPAHVGTDNITTADIAASQHRLTQEVAGVTQLWSVEVTGTINSRVDMLNSINTVLQNVTAKPTDTKPYRINDLIPRSWEGCNEEGQLRSFM